MARQKVVNGVYYDLTAEEEAELVARAEASDLDMNMVRSQRNGMLAVTTLCSTALLHYME